MNLGLTGERMDYAHHSLFCECCRHVYNPEIVDGHPKHVCPGCGANHNQTVLMGMDHICRGEKPEIDKYRLPKISDDV